MNVLLWYPKCSTCQKAKTSLEKKGISFTLRDIKEENPTKEELNAWYKKSNQPLKNFFNTSGLLYKEWNLKEKLSTMSEEEQLELLSTNGMLVKRPLLIMEDKIIIGFKEKEYENL